MHPFLRQLSAALLLLSCGLVPRRADAEVSGHEKPLRESLARAMTSAEPEEQLAIVRQLADDPDAAAVELLRQWREGEVYLLEPEEGDAVPVLLGDDADDDGLHSVRRFVDLEPVTGPDGQLLRVDPSDLEPAETDSELRRAMKDVGDMLAFADPDPARRLRAVQDTGLQQEAGKLEALNLLQGREQNRRVLRAITEAIALIHLQNGTPEERVGACETLGRMGSIPATDALRTVRSQAEASGDDALAAAAGKALDRIASHVRMVNTAGTVFRGLSLGSVLLVVAIGLAITFGLMGVINMAHGELIVIGAYTTYLVQNLFAGGVSLQIPLFVTDPVAVRIPGMNLTGGALDSYFLFAIPLSFLTAAVAGMALERSVIRFLYKRPLESLLATWGVSLVLQQLFRLTFGANNVQVDSPTWLSGNWTVHDIQFGWNRLFVIAFALVIVVLTWAVLNRTPLGLLIRSVMQNREMAACMGVRTERVNLLTFAFGSGLAGMAGAFLSQIGNVGPSLGQSYIVDSFMTVVVGGVGNLAGTVLSALGIGMVDQSLQQILGNPVLGKVLVLGAIILFLQWRPAGIFVTRSRSLDN